MSIKTEASAQHQLSLLIQFGDQAKLEAAVKQKEAMLTIILPENVLVGQQTLRLVSRRIA